MLGHVDRKLVKQVRAAALNSIMAFLMRELLHGLDGHDLRVRRDFHGRT